MNEVTNLPIKKTTYGQIIQNLSVQLPIDIYHYSTHFETTEYLTWHLCLEAYYLNCFGVFHYQAVVLTIQSEWLYKGKGTTIRLG